MPYASKEKARERSKQHYKAHTEKYKERDKRYREEHPESCRKKSLKFYHAHPDETRAYRFSKQGKGYLPINVHKRGYSAHHLYLESNNAFCIYIPEFVHSFYKHSSKTWEGMDTINAVALSIFIDGDEQILSGAVA